MLGEAALEDTESMIAEAEVMMWDEAAPEEVESAIAEAEADMLGEVALEDTESKIAEADVVVWDEAAPKEVESMITDAQGEVLGEAAPEPVMVGNGDPWSEEEMTGTLEEAEVEKHEPEVAIEEAGHREIAVSAEDNQLQLRLQGTGAIIESGQVRAIDIEVPVPGSWVGNRRVTLQLRLTLTPDTEDENGGSGGPS